MPQTFSSLKKGNKFVELDGWKELAWEFHSILLIFYAIRWPFLDALLFFRKGKIIYKNG
jgi:hypothetical protein